MNLYIIIGIGVVVAGLVGLAIWHSKWLFGLGQDKGEIDQRLRESEGAREAEQDMNSVMVERRDTSDTRKRLQDGDF
jgi:hypothetical protein